MTKNVHPGEVLKQQEFLEPLNVSAGRLARATVNLACRAEHAERRAS